ncbi:MAG: PadR family transcriptional regulator [Gemmatimonadota bacterium]
MSGSNLFTGTLDLLVLQTLAGQKLHGYAIGRSIRAAGGDALAVEEGALYPALHRLEARGLLEAGWGRTDTGRRAKFYTLTADGRAHMEAERARWEAHARAVWAVLEAGGAS